MRTPPTVDDRDHHGAAALVEGKSVPYDIKPLSCDPRKLRGLSEKLIVSHWENNYGGAVKRLNAITSQLASLDFAAAPVFTINGLKREELIATNSMILHALYFDGLGADGELDRPLNEALMRDFGSVERWRAEFVAVGKAMGGGSGWVLLAGGIPILALDMYGHSYHMDYDTAAAKYVDAFMDNIRWTTMCHLHHQHA